MIDILGSNPGYISVLESPGGNHTDFEMDGFDETVGFQAIVTRVDNAPRTSHQFRHSLDRWVYLYVFGDRTAEMVVSGLAFARSCFQDGQTYHGVEWVQYYYNTNKLSERADPVIITIGTDTAFEAFLKSANWSLNDPDRGLAQFTFLLEAIP